MQVDKYADEYTDAERQCCRNTDENRLYDSAASARGVVQL
jgi:hypothetical protein